MTMHLRPALGYQMKDYRNGIGVLLVIITAIIGAPSLVMLALGSTDQHINFNGFGGVVAWYMFVCGIAVPRPGMRMNIQLGISRRTTFASQILSAALASLLIAAAGEILMAAAQVLTRPLSFAEFTFSDLYATFYLGYETTVLDLTFLQHITSILFTTCLLFLCWAVGAFFTFLFWRLSRFGCVVAGILMACLLVGGPTYLVVFQESALARALFRFVELLLRNSFQSPWFAMMLFLIAAALFLVIDWLLVRNANIRETAGK